VAVESLNIAIATQELLNNLLEDDILDDGYILTISIYVGTGSVAQDRLPFGKHKRAFLYRGVPDYSNIISLEASGEQIERLPNIRDERGRMLVMVSASDTLRDQLQNIVRGYLHQNVKMVKLDFQPE